MRQRTARNRRHALPTALRCPQPCEAVPGVLPPEAVPLVCVGYQNGSLGPAVSQAIAARNLYEPVWQSIVPKIGYICLLPAVAAGIVAFIMMKIIPQYEKIFRDFGISLPTITLGCCRSAVGSSFGCCWALCGCSRLGLLVYGLLRYAGSIRWDLPGMAWLFRRRHVATVLDALALAAQRQRPLGEALSTLAVVLSAESIERRLWAVYDDVQAGGDDLQCLYASGLLGKTDLALLQSARRNGNLAWAAREMADSNRRRFIYRTYALLQVVFPAVIVSYGLVMARHRDRSGPPLGLPHSEPVARMKRRGFTLLEASMAMLMVCRAGDALPAILCCHERPAAAGLHAAHRDTGSGQSAGAGRGPGVE